MIQSCPEGEEPLLDTVLVQEKATIQLIQRSFLESTTLNVWTLLFLLSRTSLISQVFTILSTWRTARREDYSEELKFVFDFYLDDFDASNLAILIYSFWVHQCNQVRMIALSLALLTC